MFLDIVAVLLLTFLSALGLITVSDWLMGKAFGNRVSATPFIIADVSSVKESEVECAIRYLLGSHDYPASSVFLDCREVSEGTMLICVNLAKRFGCRIFYSDEELYDFVFHSLQLPPKSI